MAQLTASRIFNGIAGLFVALDSTDQTLLKQTLYRRKYSVDVHDSATAATAFTKSLIYKNETSATMKVTLGECTSAIAVTGHASNYATFIVTKLDAAGLNGATVASYATDVATTKDMVANLPVTMTLTDANVLVPPGYILVGEVTKAASGVAITAATSRAKITVVVEPV